MCMNYQAESIKLHAKLRGKIELKSKVSVNTREDLSLAYSPGVAGPSLEIAADKSKTNDLTWRGNTIAVVSDGSAVLGLGNIGPEAALPVMEGKALLFKEFAGIDAVPIILGTQDPEEIIKTLVNLAPSFAGYNLEDISAPRCFEIETRLQALLDIPVFHDDQHGTAIVLLAALINSSKVLNIDLKQTKIVINGAGAAAVASAKLLHKAGFGHILMCDSKGIISKDRPDLAPYKQELLKFINLENISGDLSVAIKSAKVFIGLSVAGALTTEMVQTMSPDCVVMAMANPTPEIMPDLAKQAGAAIVATGRSDFPNQVNNVLGFPGIFRGLLDKKITKVTDQIKIRAANAIAGLVTNPTAEEIIPSPLNKDVARVVAAAV